MNWFGKPVAHDASAEPVAERRWPPDAFELALERAEASFSPTLVPTLLRLAALEPTTLAVMHGASFRGDGATQLRALAAGYAPRAADAA